ncbi:hypothetical protein [Maricaulis sp.]|uniref:hypothetical protein n=1 Tax=Maricaulis sp. TaxID=1486257 RepID=UPI001B00A2F5|nr:hypothetical protein [Maricaulis sp.]MBO6763778.1 hypothetical protein [Maricaulis sp.]
MRAILAVTLGSAVLAAGMAIAASGHAQTGVGVAEDADPRTPIRLTAEEQSHIVETMRIFLSGSQAIMEAGSEGDLDRLREAAAEMATPRPMMPGMGARMPDSFRGMGQMLRQDLAAIAALPDETPVTEAQAAAASAMYTCIACHDSYRVEVVSSRSEPGR